MTAVNRPTHSTVTYTLQLFVYRTSIEISRHYPSRLFSMCGERITSTRQSVSIARVMMTQAAGCLSKCHSWPALAVSGVPAITGHLPSGICASVTLGDVPRWPGIARSPCLWNQLPASLRQPHPSFSSSDSRVPAPVASSSSVDSPLSSSITPLIVHSRLETYLFHKCFPL